MNNMQIAIDGPAGAGKSTISKLLADRLNINYINTGAMYRALTLKCLRNNIDINDEKAVADLCKITDIDFRNNIIYLDGENVGHLITSKEVNQNVSNVAKIVDVRLSMVEKQRFISEDKSVILDGRDVGTYIFPNTKYKFYLNASPEERGKRRFLELKYKGENVDLYQITNDIIKRDLIDSSRDFAPLVKAEDAIEIDSSFMTIEEVVDCLEEKIKELMVK
ncbi:(d)CMP kinase [Peptostreptococcus equinus]|uniref:Cytidylate kinase n=1 Tax=Peptostreptococcus equinus TaxID=3003601 RepID=A0ABY7JU76_9FIRM|nr:(d)CMP kinase [Peptostreptococcus sp. CBA3647]WAW15713.1 (d)CMP kinase [Peptostreptococcus sp. CBA3647]